MIVQTVMCPPVDDGSNGTDERTAQAGDNS